MQPASGQIARAEARHLERREAGAGVKSANLVLVGGARVDVVERCVIVGLWPRTRWPSTQANYSLIVSTYSINGSAERLCSASVS